MLSQSFFANMSIHSDNRLLKNICILQSSSVVVILGTVILEQNIYHGQKGDILTLRMSFKSLFQVSSFVFMVQTESVICCIFPFLIRPGEVTSSPTTNFPMDSSWTSGFSSWITSALVTIMLLRCPGRKTSNKLAFVEMNSPTYPRWYLSFCLIRTAELRMMQPTKDETSNKPSAHRLCYVLPS